MKRKLSAVVALVAAFVMLAAAGSNGDSPEESTTTTAEETTTTAEETTTTAEDSDSLNPDDIEFDEYEPESDPAELVRVIESMGTDPWDPRDDFTVCVADQMIQSVGVDDSIRYFDALNGDDFDSSNFETENDALRDALRECGSFATEDIIDDIRQQIDR